MDFFFVLSGFIIFYAHAADIGQPARLGRYLRNRFARVYPIYWVFTVAVVVVGLAGFGHSPLPTRAWDWISVVSLIRLTETPTPLNVAWTLFYEIAFYALFAVLIVSKRLGIAVFAVWAAVLIVLNHTTSTESVVGVWTSRLCMNFFFGIFACWLHARVKLTASIALISSGILGLGLCGVFVDDGLGDAFGSLVAASCAALIAGCAALERTTPLSFGPLAAMGDASYTLYLAHVHIEAPLMRLHLMQRLAPDLAFIVAILITVIVSYGLYRLVELPLVRLVRMGLSHLSAGQIAPVGVR